MGINRLIIFPKLSALINNLSLRLRLKLCTAAATIAYNNESVNVIKNVEICICLIDVCYLSALRAGIFNAKIHFFHAVDSR